MASLSLICLAANRLVPAAGADLETKPGDDFFRYANGTWLDRVQIPPDKAAYSLRLAMTDLTEQRLHDLVEEAAKKAEHKPATTEGKVGAFYKAFMDEGRVEKEGAAPLKEKLAEIPAATTREKLAAMMGRQNDDFEGAIFGTFIDVDAKNPKRYVVYLGQQGIGLPDRDYYLKPDFAAQKGKYQAYVAQLLHHHIAADRFPLAARLRTLKSALAKARSARSVAGARKPSCSAEIS